jgi:S1-C subfamily serine protease
MGLNNYVSLVILLLCCFGWPELVQAQGQLRPDAMLQIRRATVSIRVLSATGEELNTGSGVFISPDGLILTCAHVVLPAGTGHEISVSDLNADYRYEVSVRPDTTPESYIIADAELLATGIPVPDQRVARSVEEADIAVIKIQPLKWTYYLTLISAYTAGQSLPIWSTGYPERDQDTPLVRINSGEVQVLKQAYNLELPNDLYPNLSDNGKPAGLIEHSASVQVGMSGGAVVDAGGQIVGINVQVEVTTEEAGAITNLAMSSDAIVSFMTKYKLKGYKFYLPKRGQGLAFDISRMQMQESRTVIADPSGRIYFEYYNWPILQSLEQFYTDPKSISVTQEPNGFVIKSTSGGPVFTFAALITGIPNSTTDLLYDNMVAYNLVYNDWFHNQIPNSVEFDNYLNYININEPIWKKIDLDYIPQMGFSSGVQFFDGSINYMIHPTLKEYIHKVSQITCNYVLLHGSIQFQGIVERTIYFPNGLDIVLRISVDRPIVPMGQLPADPDIAKAESLLWSTIPDRYIDPNMAIAMAKAMDSFSPHGRF